MGSVKKINIRFAGCKHKCIKCDTSEPLEHVKKLLDDGKTIRSVLPGCHPQVNFKPFVLVA